MPIRPATPADIPAMMQLVNHSATAAHWSREQYDRVFGSATPRRVALVIEEQGILQGFLVAHEVVQEWEIENIAIASAARRRGLARPPWTNSPPAPQLQLRILPILGPKCC